MRSPAAAIAWELGRPHRWGFAAVGLYIAVLLTLRLLVFTSGTRIALEESWKFALLVIVPASSTVMYFMAVFSFGLAGDLASRRSVYPARMFTLPLTASALAGLPMLYGATSVSVLWLATRLFAPWPAGVDVPLVWPALFCMVILGWTQALTWMPYALRGLRVIAMVLWLTVIGFVVNLAIHFEAPESLMLALLAPLVPLAYVVARSAVVRARREETPDWRSTFAWFARIGRLLPGRPGRFASPAQAQAWFEWRRHGRSLPALVAILLPFELSMLFLFRGNPVIVLETLVAVLLTPWLMAAFVAATVNKSSPEGRDAYELTPFLATRPMTSASMIGAKLRATIRSTLATWLLVLVALPFALGLSGNSTVVVDAVRQLVEVLGTPRAIVIGLLGLLTLGAFTWKQLVKSLYIGVSGRAWLVKASVFVTLMILTIVVPLVPWMIKNGNVVIATLWDNLPWILTLLVGCKIFTAAWVAIRLHQSRLLSDRALVVGALYWDVAVLALFALLVWLVPTLIFPSYLLALVAILAIPLARVSAAPLALAWNRHR